MQGLGRDGLEGWYEYLHLLALFPCAPLLSLAVLGGRISDSPSCGPEDWSSSGCDRAWSQVSPGPAAPRQGFPCFWLFSVFSDGEGGASGWRESG